MSDFLETEQSRKISAKNHVSHHPNKSLTVQKFAPQDLITKQQTFVKNVLSKDYKPLQSPRNQKTLNQ